MTADNPAAAAGRQDGYKPYAGVLAECRGMLEARASAALVRAIAKLDERLQAQREERARGLEAALAEMEAQSQLRALARDLEGRFRAGFAPTFRRHAEGAPTQAAVYGEPALAPSQLSLVDDAQVSEELAAKNLANRLTNACAGELPDFEARVAFMLGRESIESADNPLGPGALCETLKKMCWSLDTTNETRQLLLDLLAGQLAEELVPIYKEINELLVARRILPLGRPWVRRAREDRRQTPRPEARERRRDSASLVEQLFLPRTGAGGSDLPLRPDWQSSSSGGELMQMLTRLQMGETQVSLGDHAFSLQDAVARSGTGNVINALLDAGLGKHLGAVEGIVIDVVATLFDYIFNDDRVPAPMKGLIGRLQIPVLKLAMMDHSFFSNRSQPARKLINTLAQAAITWEGELTPDSWLYRSAEACVLRVQNEFADKPDVFAACLAAVEAELAEQERRADERAAALTGRLEQRERQEIARSVAQGAIAAHESNAELPESVRTFLAGPWLTVLARATLEGGEDGAAWREACATMDELVWSVLPKTALGDRQRLVQRLPALLKGLRTGLDAAQVEQPVREAFFTELVKLHAAAVKAGMQERPAAHHEIEEPTVPVPLLPTGPEARSPVDEPRETFEVEMLRRGDWIELTDETGEVRRVRLTWISPARTMYLFANRQGQRALALTRSELARRFASKEAFAASEEALMDRIVDDVLDRYQQQPEGRPR